MAEELIPITMFIVFGVCIVAFYYYNHKNRLSVMKTVQKAVESGGELNPELMERLGAMVNPKVRDLRRGIVLVSLGLAGLLASFFFDVPEVVSGLRAGSLFPFLLGGGFLLVWKLNKD